MTNDVIIKNCPLLQSLNLSRNRINNLVIEGCPAIEYLCLEGNLFLPNVNQLPNLKWLEIFKLKEEDVKKFTSVGNKYNLQDFKNWLNADETRKRGMSDWENLFASLEKDKLWRTEFMKERGCKNVDFDKLNDLDFFSNYTFCYNHDEFLFHEHENSNPHYSVLLQWFEERDKIKTANAQEWMNDDEEIKWNKDLHVRTQQAYKLEKEKSELEGILEKFAKRNEYLEQERQELSKQLAEMKLKLEDKMEAKVEVDTNK